jgi:hypothetical protein
MQLIIDFMYEGKCCVQSENALEILDAAKKFKLKELENYILGIIDQN